MVYTITAEADTRLCCSYDLCDVVWEVLNGGALHEGEEGGEQDQQRLTAHKHCATSNIDSEEILSVFLVNEIVEGSVRKTRYYVLFYFRNSKQYFFTKIHV